MRATTGDSVKSINTKAVDLVKLPIIAQVDLANASHYINGYQDSGKEAGAAVLVKLTTGGKIVLAIAQGSTPTSKWEFMTADATGITPA